MNTLRTNNLEKILIKFTHISTFIQLNNSIGFTDLNTSMEDFFIFILNKVLNTNLINANRDELNYPVIDLYDLKARKAVQVTSNDRLIKKTETVNKFFEKHLNNNFDILYIFFLKNKANLNYPKYISNSYILRMKDFTSLYSDIRRLDDNKIQEIVDYIEKNLIFTPIHDSTNIKKIEIKEDDLKGFINKSGHFSGGEYEKEDIENAMVTYKNLFNIVGELSGGARRYLLNIIYHSIKKSSKEQNPNILLEGIYMGLSSLKNRYGDDSIKYVNELIEAHLGFIDTEIMYQRMGYNYEAISIYYRGELIDGNAFAFLYDYLDYDCDKLEQILVNLNFSSLR